MRRTLGLAGAVLVVALVLVGAGLWLAGWRAYVMSTPSMGKVAPVGSLVFTEPTHAVRVGEVVAVRPPGRDVTFVHRVVQVTPAGVRTKGDLDSSPDPWFVSTDRIVGRAVTIWPGWGWVLRQFPLAAAITLAGWLVAQVFWRDNAPLRHAAMLCAVAFGIAVSALVYRPLVNADLVTVRVTSAHHAQVEAVPTGILPVKVVPVTKPGRPVAGPPGAVLVAQAAPVQDRVVVRVEPYVHGWWWLLVVAGVGWPVPAAVWLARRHQRLFLDQNGTVST